MKIGELISWRTQVVVWKDSEQKEYIIKEKVGLLTRILYRPHVHKGNLLEIKTFQGETILAPESECYLWCCPKNPGCYCGACHP